MPVVDSSARKIRLMIDGVDVSKALLQAEGGYSQYDRSGLCRINATFVLGRPVGIEIDLDPDTNSTWARGKKIELMIAEEAFKRRPRVKCPVLGTLFILRSSLDYKTNRLTIEAGCKISLLSGRTGTGEGFCASPESPQPLSALAGLLLAKSGLGGSIAVSGLIKKPYPKIDGESYLDILGRLAWSSGTLVYQDKDGEIVSTSYAGSSEVNKDLAFTQRDLIDYTDSSGSETPAEKIVVTGTKEIPSLINYGNNDYIVTTSFGDAKAINPNASGKIIMERKFHRKIMSWTGRTISDETLIDRPAGAILPEYFPGRYALTRAERKIMLETYEKGRPRDCYSPDEARLLTQTTTIDIPFGVAAREYIAKKDPRTFFSRSVTTLIPAEKIETKYYYSGLNKGEIYRKETSIQKAAVYAIPNAFNGTGVFTGLTNLQLVETETIVYKKVGKIIQIETVKMQARGIANPESVQAQTNPRLSDWFGLIPIESNVESSTTGQTTPPNPERFPPKYEWTQENLSVKHPVPGFGGNLYERERNFSIDSLFVQDEFQLKKIAQIEAQILWGRHYSKSITMPLFDELLKGNPNTIVILQMEKSGKAYRCDGFRVSLSNNQFLCGFEGILLGVNGGTLAEYDEAIATNDLTLIWPGTTTDGDDVIIRIDDDFKPPFQQALVLAGKSTDNGRFIFDYSLDDSVEYWDTTTNWDTNIDWDFLF